MSAVLVASPVFACLNEVGTTRVGERVALNEHSPADLRESMTFASPKSWVVPWSRNVIADVRKDPSDDHLNDLAVALVRLGRPRKAIMLLEIVEKRAPGRYQTASNLGTAYELAGDNVQALHWIKEGIHRNTRSHFGSEWLHVSILEAKLAKSPSTSDSLLGLDFGSAVVPEKPRRLPAGNDGKPVSTFELANALRYQLRERTFFVAPEDPIVARLFYDWGNLEFAVGSIEFADLAYDLALQYGHPQRALIERRRAAIARVVPVGPEFEHKPGVVAPTSCETCDVQPPPASLEESVPSEDVLQDPQAARGRN